MSNDKMREEFEARVKAEQGLDLTRLPHGGYRSFATHQAWWAWQASRAAPAVQGEPVAWKELAANWLREKAAAQQALNKLYPEHAKCYPTWKNWDLKLNWLADELSAGAAPQPAEQQPSDYPDHPGWTGSADCITAMALLERLDTDNDGRVEQIRALIGRIGADVDRLVEALEQCITSMLDSGYRADAVVIRAARAALAAYRQGGEE